MSEEDINSYLTSRRSYYVRIAQRRTKLDDVDDMVQEAMLEVAKALRAHPGKPDTYYNKVAAYAVAGLIAEGRFWTGMQRGGQWLDPMRQGGFTSLDEKLGGNDTEEADPEVVRLFSGLESGYEAVDNVVSLSRVREAVSGLPAQQRKVAVGVANDLTKAQIAERMGLSINTVRFYWVDIVAPRLREELADLAPNGERKAA